MTAVVGGSALGLVELVHALYIVFVFAFAKP